MSFLENNWSPIIDLTLQCTLVGSDCMRYDRILQSAHGFQESVKFSHLKWESADQDVLRQRYPSDINKDFLKIKNWKPLV